MTRKTFSKILTATILTAGLLLAGKPVAAAVRCETYYGGEVCVKTGELQIDKEVFSPAKKEFVDNLWLETYKFAPGEEITFKLKIKNIGDKTFEKVKVTDTLPSLLELASGELSFEIKNLEVDKPQEKEIKVKVVSASKFPNDKTVVCVVNTAEASSSGEKDKDTSQVCLTKKVLGVTVMPVTGPENWFALSLLAFLLALAGVTLIRKNFSKA